MKTFCEVCTSNPATMVCVADDAVLCGNCENSVHSGSKTQKRETVAFKSSSAKPNCDICQVNPVFAVCREDRAFLCRTCDLAIHSANEHVAKHERFLFTGVSIELNSTPAGSAAEETARERMSAAETASSSRAVAKQAGKIQNNDITSFEDNQVPDFNANKTSNKRKAGKTNSFSSQDYAVPDINSVQNTAQYNTQELGDFVADLLAPPSGKMQKVSSMSDFLEGLFDDDFPVDCLTDDSLQVPDMANAPTYTRRL